jgi:arylsulfatase
MPEVQRRLAARLQEAFAAFLEHTDAQIGRLVDALTDMGLVDDTIVVLLSDNGASQEGGPLGVLHEMKFFNFLLETPEEAVDHLDDIGGPDSHSNYPWGWAQAGNTPFKWYKQNTHEGGVHVPCIVHWPDRLGSAAGALRHQFHHVTDVVPTIYDALGVTPPDVYRGYEQLPIAGTSMVSSFTAAPDAPSAKPIQYFEMVGHRGLWQDGWKAVTRHVPNTPFDDDQWELYHVDVDRSECHDLAAAEPERLQRMIDLWWEQAHEHGVLPLDDRGIELFGARFRDGSPHRADRHYTYRPPMSAMPAQVGAGIGGRSWDLDARIDRAAGENGVLYATGTGNSGVAVFLQDEKLVLDYNEFGTHRVVESTRDVPVGASTVGVRFRRTEGKTGRATLVVDGEESGTLDLPFVMNIISSIGPSIGYDHGSPVSDRYRDAFPFAGTLHQVDIQLVERSTAPDTVASEQRAGMGRQ